MQLRPEVLCMPGAYTVLLMCGKSREVIYPIHSGCHPIFFIHDAALRLSRTAASGHQYGLIQAVLYTRQAVCVCVVQSASPDSHRAVATSLSSILRNKA